MLPKLLSLMLFISPFEKEQDFVQTHFSCEAHSPLQIASFWLIALHQNCLTHIDGPRSHFVPCSSTYMKQAITKHGFFLGSLLGLDRLLRENEAPWIYKKVKKNQDWIKSDPVP